MPPPSANFLDVYNAGKENGMADLFGINGAIGQFGKFDFQRDAGLLSQTFYPSYTNSANYAVGVYMNGADFSMSEVRLLGTIYAMAKSSNAGAPEQVRWWANGWNAAQQGNLNGVGPSGARCTTCPCR